MNCPTCGVQMRVYPCLNHPEFLLAVCPKNSAHWEKITGLDLKDQSVVIQESGADIEEYISRKEAIIDNLDELVKNYEVEHADEVKEALDAVASAEDAVKERAEQNKKARALLVDFGCNPDDYNPDGVLDEIKQIYGVKEA